MTATIYPDRRTLTVHDMLNCASRLFSSFCGRREADGLFNEAFINAWVKDRSFENCYIEGVEAPHLDDQFSLYLMGGEL